MTAIFVVEAGHSADKHYLFNFNIDIGTNANVTCEQGFNISNK